MLKSTTNHVETSSPVFLWLVSVIPGILFSITVVVALEASKSSAGAGDWQAAAAAIQRIAIAGTLLYVSVHTGLSGFSAIRATVERE